MNIICQHLREVAGHFTAVGAAEGIIQIKTGKMISMLEQQLVDRSKKRVNQACITGSMTDAFDYIIVKWYYPRNKLAIHNNE
ncbi:hypothetical protein TB2_036215 [Malus domestica]